MRVSRTIIVTVAAGVLALSGCSDDGTGDAGDAADSAADSGQDDGSDTDDGGGDASGEAPGDGGAGSLEDVAASIDCTGWEQSTDAAPHVERWGTCQLDGVRVQLYAFAGEDDVAAFYEAAAEWGVTEDATVRHGLIVAAPDDEAALSDLEAALTG